MRLILLVIWKIKDVLYEWGDVFCGEILGVIDYVVKISFWKELDKEILVWGEYGI